MSAHLDRSWVRSSLAELPSLLEHLGIARPLVVADGCVLRACDIDPRALVASPASVWTEVRPHPSEQHLRSLLGSLDGVCAPDGVIGFGGGSAIDLAKGAAAALGAGLAPAELLRRSAASGPLPGAPLPIVAIPTTIGTGSEATHFAAYYADGRKVSLADPRLRPAGVVLDAGLLARLPAGVAADSALDATAQAAESIWALGATGRSTRDAARALREAMVSAAPAVDGDAASRARMLLAAHLAGRAIDVSKTTAAHALAYPFTMRFGVPHGLAVAFWLPAVLRYNAAMTRATCADPRRFDELSRRVEIVVRLLGGIDAKESAALLAQHTRRLGRPATLTELGIDSRSALAALREGADPVRLSNNPRVVLDTDLPELVELASRVAMTDVAARRRRRSAS